MWKSLIFTFRTLRRSPLFTSAAVLSLALGIGANTAIFSLLDQVALRLLPVNDPERLVLLHSSYDPPGTSSSDSSETVYSYPMYRDLRDQDPAFSGIIARMGAGVTLLRDGNAESVSAEVVTGNFFSTLGVGAAVGRTLTPGDDGAPGANPVIVLGHSYWMTHLGGNPAIVNQKVQINGNPVAVVGVVEPRFHGLMPGRTPDLFLPVALQKIVRPSFDLLEDRHFRWLNLFARLKPGMTLPKAQAATDVVYASILRGELQQMNSMRRDKDRNEFLNHRAVLKPAAQGINSLGDQFGKPLAVMMAMVAVVLLIACANVANLLLARATGRQREIAVRLALGASRGSMIRQLLLEGLVLAMTGGALAVLVARWSVAGLLHALPKSVGGPWLSAGLSFSLLGFTFALATACGLLFSLAPALQATIPDLASTLKNQAANVMWGGSAMLRQTLVVAQMALSFMLVVGAGLFTGSLMNLTHVNLGFRTQHMMMFGVNAGLSRPKVAPAVAFYRDLEARLRAIPGVVGVGAAADGPFSGGSSGGNISVAGYQKRPDEYVGASYVAVGSGFFQAMGVPLRAGREFNDRDDASAPKVAVVNEAFVRKYLANRNPIGVRMENGESTPPLLDITIVGVVADSHVDVRKPAKETWYLPYSQWTKPSRLQFYVRSAGDESRLAQDIRQVLRSADPNVPMGGLKPMDVWIGETIYVDRLIAILAGAFGGLATLLAAIGLYGVVAYAVARRTSEIGVRMALGAQPGRVLRMILRETARMVATGIAIGLVCAFLVRQKVESVLFGLHGGDPMVFGGAAAVLALVALTAAIVPAWRASRIEPVVALKYE